MSWPSQVRGMTCPVQGTFLCGMSRRSHVCGMSFVFRIKFVWDVSKRLKVAGCASILVAPRKFRNGDRRDDRHLPGNRTLARLPLAHVRFGTRKIDLTATSQDLLPGGRA
jgi:hypothetical protein